MAYSPSFIAGNDAWIVSPLSHWDGHRWTAEKTFRYDEFKTIAAINATDIWAAGWTQDLPATPVFTHYTC